MTKQTKPVLTRRDEELLDYLIVGLKDRDIATETELTPGTVRVYLHGLYQRLGVTNRTQAAVWWSKQKRK